MSKLIDKVQAFTDSTRERWSNSEMSMATALLEEVIEELSNREESKVIKDLKVELNTVIYQNAEAENTIIKLRAAVGALKVKLASQERRISNE